MIVVRAPTALRHLHYVGCLERRVVSTALARVGEPPTVHLHDSMDEVNEELQKDDTLHQRRRRVRLPASLGVLKDGQTHLLGQLARNLDTWVAIDPSQALQVRCA